MFGVLTKSIILPVCCFFGHGLWRAMVSAMSSKPLSYPTASTCIYPLEGSTPWGYRRGLTRYGTPHSSSSTRERTRGPGYWSTACLNLAGWSSTASRGNWTEKGKPLGRRGCGQAMRQILGWHEAPLKRCNILDRVTFSGVPG
jgi:hypothetical protein